MSRDHCFLSLLLLSAPLVLIGAATARGQHDPQRNATQAIAIGNFERAEKELAKADAADPETLFVRMMLALKQGKTDGAVRFAKEALDAGLPFARLVAGPRELLGPLYETPQFAAWRQRYKAPALLHGPMVGSVTATSASFWVRTSRAAKVQVKSNTQMSAIATTGVDGDYTAVVTVKGLSPNQDHAYTVLIDGEAQHQGRFRTYPETGKPGAFAVAFGGGAGYVPKWERMWDTIGKFKPHALLMLGDNVYIDQPKRKLCQHYCYYRRQARPEWRRLVAATPTYAIYDDHDFGVNDCVPGPEIDSPPWKRSVWNIFRQNWVNPAYGGGEANPGCWSDFRIGDVHFLLLDGRYYRDLKGKSMLGAMQKAWLFETLEKSDATFKVLASPVPWSAGVKPGSRDTWDGFPEEREEVFSFLESQRIDGVFLIAADRHRTDLRTTERDKNGYDLFEFESSRLTNRHTHKVVVTPGLIWGYNKKCSFGLMRFDTRGDAPHVVFECVNIDGEVLHRYKLSADRLTHR